MMESGRPDRGARSGDVRLGADAFQGPFRLLGLPFVPVPVWHGETEVLGYRLGPFAYVTDCSRIPEESFRLLAGVETLVLDALRYRPHSTHFPTRFRPECPP